MPAASKSSKSKSSEVPLAIKHARMMKAAQRKKYKDLPCAAAHEAIDDFLPDAIAKAARAGRVLPLASIPAADGLLKQIRHDPSGVQMALVPRVMAFWPEEERSFQWAIDGDPDEWRVLRGVAAAVQRQSPVLSAEDLLYVLDVAAGPEIIAFAHFAFAGAEHFVGAVERSIAANGLTPALSAAIAHVRAAIDDLAHHAHKSEPRLINDGLREVAEKATTTGKRPRREPPDRKRAGDNRPRLKAGEPWADAANTFLASQDGEIKKAWLKLIDTARKAPGSSPSNRWLKQSRELVGAVRAAAFKRTLCEWMLLACKGVMVPDPMNGRAQIESGLDVKNADVLKGLVWAAGSLDDASLAAPLGDFAEQCYKKLRWVGPRCAKVGNACVAALAAMTGDAPAAQLSRLKQRVKQPTGKRMTGKAMERFAGRSGITVEDVEDRSIPTHGLAADGTRTDEVGGVTVRLAIAGTGVDVTWTGPDGTTRTSAPASLKKSHAARLKELAAQHKQIKTDLVVHRDRIERMYLDDRSVSFAAWRDCYLKHPLVGTLARRLIWTIGDAAMIPDGEQLRDSAGKLVKPPVDAAAPVRPWHPAGRSVADVLAWRARLAEMNVTQPFKQAHREVYLLTDAERKTKTYSNRFAAHLLRQQQFAALCGQRGWRYRLIGSWDPGGDITPTLAIPKHNLRAQFWIDYGVGGETRTGVAQLVSTDQVRFYEAKATRPLPLAKVPPTVFSEVMRDVDLFVGVASVGNDPTWLPGGNRVGDYWHRYSFGDLSASAETRKQVLETLLPRLTKLRDRAKLADKFLVVRGDLRTYKIHLGSGNILMEPNDQYLCIVPDRTRAGGNVGDDQVHLPFEGDSTLSVILSKAFLLADDTKIKDPTITRQIGKAK